MDSLKQALKQLCRDRLPDIPLWVETRDLLARADTSLVASDDGSHFVVWSKTRDIGAVVGEPDPVAIVGAAATCTELLAFPNNVDTVRQHLPHVDAERATILAAPASGVRDPAYPCRILEREEVAALSHVPGELRAELAEVARDGTWIITALDGDLPVAFAYVASETETLWDVSIDTVHTHRRRGFAEAAVLTLMAIMAGQGKRAVWGAAQSNPASFDLAVKLGFTRAGELWILTTP